MGKLRARTPSRGSRRAEFPVSRKASGSPRRPFGIAHPRQRSRLEARAPLRGGGAESIRLRERPPLLSRPATEAQVRDGRQGLGAGEARLRRLLEAVGGYTYSVCLSEGRVISIEFHSGCEAVTGYTLAELTAEPSMWNLIVLPEDRPKVEGACHEMLANPRRIVLEHRIRSKDGTLRWLRQVLVPYMDRAGALEGYDAVVLDVTEGERRSAALAATVEGQRRLLDSNESMAFSIDRSGRLVAANSAFVNAASALSGGKDPRLGERFDASSLPSSLRSELQSYFEKALAGRRAQATIGVDLGRGFRRLEFSFVPIVTSSGGVEGVAVFVGDRSPEAREREVLAAVARGIVSGSGVECLANIAQTCESWLGAAGVVIGEFLEDGNGIRVWAARLGGKSVEGAPYVIGGCSCSRIAADAFCFHPKHGPWVYPEEAGPPSLSQDCHLGLPIRAAGGELIGVLCAISQRPIKPEPFRLEVMGLMAARAGAELERLRALAFLPSRG